MAARIEIRAVKWVKRLMETDTGRAALVMAVESARAGGKTYNTIGWEFVDRVGRRLSLLDLLTLIDILGLK